MGIIKIFVVTLLVGMFSGYSWGTPEPKSCKQSSDCTLRMCTGCMSADYIKMKNPPEPPCAKYSPTVTTCACENKVCVEKALSK